jgi:putative ABC transport system permease protein
VLFLLTGEFLKLLLISYAVALPFCYFGIRTFLSQYASRMPLGITLFLLPFFGVMIIAGITVSSQVLKAAAADPVEAIKYE